MVLDLVMLDQWGGATVLEVAIGSDVLCEWSY
jgi:hypothetical protein